MAKKNFKELFDPKESKWGGISLPMFLAALVVVAIVVYVPFGLDKEGNPGSFLRPNFLIMFSALAVFGLLFGEIGDRIPIWNDFIGGGTGAGAIPMSEMWSSKTGRPASEWFAFAISILSIANVFAIICGALLKKLGEVKSNLTGNGELIIDNSKEAIRDKEVEVKPELTDTTAAFILTGILLMTAHILGELWSAFAKSHNIDFELHRLVFLILLTMFLNIANVVPDRLKAGAKRMQTFFSKHTIWILMAAVGFTTDVKEIIAAGAPSNLLIALAIVLGAVGFIMLVARKMKFYPIEAAITAGLCMANRGGAGDVAVLGAADRMDLMSFAQISSRIGGAMMLVFGSVLFSIFAS